MDDRKSLHTAKIRNGNGLIYCRMILGELPKELSQAKRYTRQYRRALEDEVICQKGKVSVTNSHHIDSAASAETVVHICR
jgi:hypothetical protein